MSNRNNFNTGFDRTKVSGKNNNERNDVTESFVEIPQHLFADLKNAIAELDRTLEEIVSAK
jgi:hypothetical protein